MLSLMLSACGEDTSPKDYLKFAGGGLVFNYRYSQASLIVIAQQKSPLPEGSIVEAQFDLPGTLLRQTVTLPAMTGKLTYKLQSGPLTQITKGGRYNVTIRLIDSKGVELDRKDKIFESDENQSTLPTKPLADGVTMKPHLENL